MPLHSRVRSAVKALLAVVGLGRPAVRFWRLARRPNGLRHELAIWSDYLRLKRHFPFLRARNGLRPMPSAAPAASVGAEPHATHAMSRGRSVLIISLSDFVAQVKAESMLAKALQVRGAEPVALTDSRAAWASRYYRAFGIQNVLAFDTYLPSEPPPPIAREIDDLVGDHPTFHTVKEFRYHDVDVGRQALATLLRALHQGKIDFDAPVTRRDLRTALGDGVRAVIAAERVLDEVKPALALINDAQYIGVGALFEAALNRGVPVIQWIGSQRDDALALKRFDQRTNRLHPFSLSDETWHLVADSPWTPERERELLQDLTERYVDGRWTSYYNRPYGAIKERSEAQRQLGLDPAKKTATIFAHILWDSTLFWGEDLFDDYEDWLIETVRAACANRNVNWLIKLHPGNVWKLKRDGLIGESVDARVVRERFGDLPNHITVLAPDADYNTYTVFELSDYCLTVRGTVGIEAAALGMPVLTAGTGRYSGLGFTIDSANRVEYLQKVSRIQDIPPPTAAQTELAKKYAHALFVLRPARFTTFQIVNLPLADLGHPLDHNVLVRARSLEDLTRAEDLAAFARWALESRDHDFLTRAPVPMRNAECGMRN